MPQVRYETGVYCIRNKIDGKRYIGSVYSRTISKRWAQHRNHLRNGKHHSRYLQRAWDKYGEEAFEFIVLCTCSPSECLALEQRYMDEYKSYNCRYGYNISPTAGNCSGVTHTEEYKKKMSIRISEVLSSKDIRKRISDGVKKAYAEKPEFIEKVRAASTGRKHTTETIEKMKLSNTPELRRKKSLANLGKPKSEETKAKMRKPRSELVKAKMKDTARKGWETRKANLSSITLADPIIPEAVRFEL